MRTRTCRGPEGEHSDLRGHESLIDASSFFLILFYGGQDFLPKKSWLESAHAELLPDSAPPVRHPHPTSISNNTDFIVPCSILGNAWRDAKAPRMVLPCCSRNPRTPDELVSRIPLCILSWTCYSLSSASHGRQHHVSAVLLTSI